MDSWTQEIPGAEPVSPYVTHQEAEPDDLIEPEGLPGQQPVMVDTSTLEYGVLQSDQVPVERHPQDKKLFVPATGAMVPVAQIPSEVTTLPFLVALFLGCSSEYEITIGHISRSMTFPYLVPLFPGSLHISDSMKRLMGLIPGCSWGLSTSVHFGALTL